MSIKRQILEDTFTQPFNIERFVKFTTEFFNGPQILSPYKRNEKVWKEYRYYIDSYRHVAKYIDGKDKNILILAVQLRKGRSVERARSMQRNFISRLISDSKYDAAIVAFYCEDEPTWRLSFVRLDYEFTAKGVKLDLTPAKRYSYLVGEGEPSHTAQEQLLPIFERESYNPTLDEIEHAFSVETVTKDFFEKYREKYYDLKEYLDNNEAFKEEAQRHNFTSEQFAKKLMGQLVFLYFLQKKGWLGVKVLPENRQLTEEEFKKIFYRQNKAGKDVLLKIFPVCESGIRKVNTYNLSRLSDEEGDILAGCFKGTEHEKPWGSGTRTFIRDLFTHCVENTNKNFFDDFLEPLFYEALNKKRGENHYYPKFNCKIPFLNGGLFEPLDNYDWQHNDFNIPNEIFSNSKIKGREADGILDIFDRYNFTINEDEPLEREVAVDPEMLGKIFENLLDAKDRKSKGAFYTPREIVHYMCQESLINYLVNETGVPYQDIKDFILYGELMKDEDCSKDFEEGKKEQRIPKTVLENLKRIDNALKQVKVADPAVGSGAFPLGMLNEIVRARMNITEYLVREIPAENKYERLLLRKNRHPYKIKWETIKNSIFAVDIESSAVDIAKLRLWLSLIVDQEIDEENPCPHPLPNLDCNIMCGNSLIDEFEGIKLFDESLLSKQEHSKDNTVESYQISIFQDQIEILLEDLFREQDRLFGEEDTAKKMEIKKRIDKTIDSIIRAKLSRDKNKEGLIKYEQSLKEKTKPYFLWKLEFAKIFKEKGGFDIIIGNPPYVDSEEMTRNLPNIREYCNAKFTSAKGNWDLFVVFIEQGFRLLCKGGTISYIVPNKLISADYTEALRKLIITYRVHELRDYSNVDVFEEVDVYPVVFRFENSKKRSPVSMVVMKDKTEIDWENTVNEYKFYNDIYWDRYFVKDSEGISIIEKMLAHTRLNDVAYVKGAATVNEAYQIKEILHEYNDDISDEYKKFINTGTIDRYESLWGKYSTKYIKNSYIKPIILLKDLMSISPSRVTEANSEKIIIGGMTKVLECYYDKGEYIAGKSTVIVMKKEEDLRYITALLNSKLITYFYKVYFNSLSLSGGYLRIGPPQIKEIPIAKPDNSVRIELVEIVEKIMTIMNNFQDSAIDELCYLKENINKKVYKIYGLTEREIELVEREEA